MMGSSCMIWDGAAVDPAVVLAEPPTYGGTYTGPANDSDFGHRCPQPGPKIAVAQSGVGRSR